MKRGFWPQKLMKRMNNIEKKKSFPWPGQKKIVCTGQKAKGIGK